MYTIVPVYRFVNSNILIEADPELEENDQVGDGGAHHGGDQGFVHGEESTSSQRYL